MIQPSLSISFNASGVNHYPMWVFINRNSNIFLSYFLVGFGFLGVCSCLRLLLHTIQFINPWRNAASSSFCCRSFMIIRSLFSINLSTFNIWLDLSPCIFICLKNVLQGAFSIPCIWTSKYYVHWLSFTHNSVPAFKEICWDGCNLLYI